MCSPLLCTFLCCCFKILLQSFIDAKVRFDFELTFDLFCLQELFINYLAASAYKKESDTKNLSYKGLCKYVIK